MPRFNYIAVDTNNKTVNGTIDQVTREEAITQIKLLNLTPISLKEAGNKSSVAKHSEAGGKIKADQLMAITRQLSAMISAGVPLLNAINTLSSHMKPSTPAKAILESVVKDIESGSSLSLALARHPKAFNDMYVNMTMAGESAGILENVFKRLALEQEKNNKIRKKVRSAMAYPIILMFITVLSFFGMMIFIVPKMGKIITDMGGPDAKLPLITEIMLGISNFLTQWWVWAFIAPPVLALFVCLVIFSRTGPGKKMLHGFLLHTPIVNRIIKKIVITRFARIYSALLESGVAVLNAISITASAVGNEVYKEKLLESMEDIKSGKSFSVCLGKSPKLFPPVVIQMLAVGEETGQTDTVLVKVAEFFEEDVDATINSLTSIIEPVMIVIMGALVGLIAASVMLPIANLSNSIQ